MSEARVQNQSFDVAVEIERLTRERTEIGGIGCFVGMVRHQSGGRPINAMTLEHYPGMTERAMAEIVGEAERRWDLLGSVLVHRVGRLLPGEPIVLVLVASAHRQAALDATAFLIDWLKTRAPFWKKEEFADGGDGWVAPREDDEVAAARWT